MFEDGFLLKVSPQKTRSHLMLQRERDNFEALISHFYFRQMKSEGNMGESQNGTLYMHPQTEPRAKLADSHQLICRVEPKQQAIYTLNTKRNGKTNTGCV
mmetsp:Transcript_20030/g.40238  ORF Transcript_20030/g.40238 Transcript_20030/m.40238 type:complete len:100 (-) Transcript_20030:537-836(-)